MTTEAFWKSLAIDHWTTYSFNRGEELVAVQQLWKRHQEQLQTPSLKERILLRKQTPALEEATNLYQARLLDKTGQFNLTAKAIRTLPAHAPESVSLEKILTASYEEGPQLGCAPIYRDAIVFYNQKKKLINVLHICFQCLQLEATNGERISAQIGIFGPLRELLTQLGHEIETGF